MEVLPMEKDNSVADIHKVGDKVFLTKQEAEQYVQHEEKLRNLLSYTYYSVYCKPDLIEGHGYEENILVGIKDFNTKNLLSHFLTSKYGKPLAFIMGTVPTDNWFIETPINCRNVTALSNFFNTEIPYSRGDYKSKKKREVYHLDDRGIVLEDVDLLVR
jgi:hypothetical protein